MLWDNHMKDNLFLLLQVFVVLPNSMNQTDARGGQPYEAMGYTVFRVNNEDGTIRFGTYEQNIYKMPINLLVQDQAQMMPFRLKFSIVQPRMQPLSVRSQLPSRKGNELPPTPQTRQYIPNFEKQYTPSEQFEEGDGIDVYIDWARYLPDNTMFTRVHVRAINSNL